MKTTDETVSKAFRAAFEAHPSRESDPALALESARETASALIPAGVTGDFDDAALTFTADEDDVTVYLTGANGPRAHYLGTMETAEVLAALPAGWTVHEDAWQSAVQIDDLTWSVPLSKAE